MYINSTCCTQCLVVYGCVEGIASCAKVRCCIACFGLPSHVSVCMLTWFQREVEWGKIQREGMKEKCSLCRTCKIVYANVLILLPFLPPIPHPHTLSFLTPSHFTPPHTSHPLTPHTSRTPYLSQSASEGDTTIAMDHGLHHHERLQEANRGLDHILNHGRDIVENLKNQGFTLKAS